MQTLTIGSFLFFTGLVAFLTWIITRHDDHESSSGYFLGGRSLTFPLIAGSLLLTNLSTEQMVGLNGAAFLDGLAVMAWEVLAVLALVLMALFFLPYFLRSGVATVPQLLETRFDSQTRAITNLIFLVAYAAILLPIILYSGAMGLIKMLDVQTLFGLPNETVTLWATVWFIGLTGSFYAVFGGLRTVAVADLLNGIGLLVGGLLIPYFGLVYYSGGTGAIDGFVKLTETHPSMLNSIGGSDSSVPFGTLFTGVLLLNLFYWCTNQQIIQRTFGASSLEEGQKGVLLTGLLKLLGPLYLVIPGMLAFALFAEYGIEADAAYGNLVKAVLPAPLTGFFAAVMVGAILSSFNSALNATSTLFSLGVYKNILFPQAEESSVVRSGKISGWIIAFTAMIIAPLLAQTESIFAYLQKMNGMYFIPIFSVVVVGLLARKVPPLAAKVALVVGFLVIGMGYFVPVGEEGPKITVNDTLVRASDETATFQVHLTKPVDRNVSITLDTVDGSATSGTNYEPREQQVSFAPGETRKTVSVPLLVDRNDGSSTHDADVPATRRDAFFLTVSGSSRDTPPVQKSYDNYKSSVAACHIIDNSDITPENEAEVASKIQAAQAEAKTPPEPASLFLTGFVHEFHFLGIVFVALVVIMLGIGWIHPQEEAWDQEDVEAVDMTPWSGAKYASAFLVIVVLLIYLTLADFSVVDTLFGINI